MDSNIILNKDTPNNQFIGNIIVLTYSQKPYSTLYIEDNDFFFLKREKLFFKNNGSKLFEKNLTNILLKVTATDYNYPLTQKIKKNLRIPVRNSRQSVIIVKVNSEKLFDLSVNNPKFNPSQNDSYYYRVSNTNNSNFLVKIKKFNETIFEFYLPKSYRNTSLYNPGSKPIMSIEIESNNNTFINHRINVEFEFEETYSIKDIILDSSFNQSNFNLIDDTNLPVILYNEKVGTIIGKLKVVDSMPNKSISDYKFESKFVNKYDFFDITSYGIVILKKKLSENLLNYAYPIVKLNIFIHDKNDLSRNMTKNIYFLVNITNEINKPPVILKIDYQFNLHAKNLNKSEYLKIGDIFLNKSIFSSNSYRIKAMSSKSFYLDDNRSLFIAKNCLLNKIENSIEQVLIHIVDENINKTVYKEMFDIDLSFLNQMTISFVECVSDDDCNQNHNGPNKCIKYKYFTNHTFERQNDFESLLKMLHILSNKDNSIFLKYDILNRMLQYPNEILYDHFRDKYSLSRSFLNNIGICLCEKGYQGFKCEFKINENYKICNKNSCNLNQSICKSSEFKLENKLDVSVFKSYYCECKNNQISGLNCEYRKNQCNLNSFIDDHSFGPISNNSLECAGFDEICYPLLNTNKKNLGSNCINETYTNENLLNYFIFDENEIQLDETNKMNYKKLNLKDLGVQIAIQNFIKDTFKHFNFNDYVKLPKGPIALLPNSIDIKPFFDESLSELNKVFNGTEEISNLILKSINQSNLDINTLDKIKQKLSQKWNFGINNMELNILNGDPNSLIKSIEKLRHKTIELFTKNISDKNFTSLFPIDMHNNSFLNYFDISNNNIKFLKIDILPGIYFDSNDKVIIRPTPGIFCSYSSKSLINYNHFIFLPGIFDPYNSKSLFKPGIMSLPITDENVENLLRVENNYLNKFIPIQIPYNFNILNNKIRQNSIELFLTPLNFKSNFEKILAERLENGELDKIINDQKQLNARNILSTLILSNPTMTSENIFEFESNNNNNQLYPKGAQFYDKIQFKNNFIYPFIFYDNNGDPIQRAIIQRSLEKYCKNYKDLLNEFHWRICQAQFKSSIIFNERNKNPDLCKNCKFVDYARSYLEKNVINSDQFDLGTDLNIASSFLASLLLLCLSLLFCCFCCSDEKLLEFTQMNKINKSDFKNFISTSSEQPPPKYEEMKKNFINHLSVVHVPLLDIPLTRIQKPNMSNSLLNLDDLNKDYYSCFLNRSFSKKSSTSEPSLTKKVLYDDENYFFQNSLLKIVPIKNGLSDTNENDEAYFISKNSKNVSNELLCDSKNANKSKENIVIEWLMSRCESLEPNEFYEIKESHRLKNYIIDNVIHVDNENKIKNPTQIELNKLIENFSKSSQSNTLRVTKKKKQIIDVSIKNPKLNETKFEKEGKLKKVFKRSSSLDINKDKQLDLNYNYKTCSSTNWAHKIQYEC